MEQEIEQLDAPVEKKVILPHKIVANIFIYALKGVKACLFDIWVILFHILGNNLDRGTEKLQKANDDLYDKTKGKNKKAKNYHYSAKMLANLEREKDLLLQDLQSAGATRSKDSHVYRYKAKNPNGKIVYGTMSGFSKLDINAFLVNEGYEVYSIKTSPMIDFVYGDSGVIGAKKLKTKDLIFWLTQLSTYIKSGITLNEAVKILSNQMKGNKTKEKAFASISYELTLGESFSNALAKQGNMFPALLINMIKAAEASGTLTETLDDMADYYTEIYNTKKQLNIAMRKPSIIMFFAIVVIVFILLYVVPRFTVIYDTYGSGLNGFTLFVVNTSNFLKNNFMLIILVFVAIIIGIIFAYKSIKVFKISTQIFLMHIPVVKDVIIYNELTIFTKTFASLLRNNVFITDSMDILSKITSNEIYKAILYRTINNIVKGDKISEAFKDHWAVPDVAYYMIVTGESTCQLAEMMQKVSDYYQEMHKNIVNNLKTFIEPVMIAFLAVVVGVIIIAIIIPMFGIYDTIQ